MSASADTSPESGKGWLSRVGGWLGSLTGKAGDVLPVRVSSAERTSRPPRLPACWATTRR